MALTFRDLLCNPQHRETRELLREGIVAAAVLLGWVPPPRSWFERRRRERLELDRWAAEYDGCPITRVAGRPRIASDALRAWAERCGLVVRPQSPPNTSERHRAAR